MKVGFVLPSVSHLAGGMFHAARLLARSLHHPPERAIGVFGLADEGTEADRASWHPIEVVATRVRGPRRFGFSKDLDIALAGVDLDILHTHGLWAYPSIASRRWSDATSRPYLISPHGMLDPWALGISRWKKRLGAVLYEDAHLKGAACLHALCASELQSIRRRGLANPVCVVANGVELPPADEAGVRSSVADQHGGHPILLFLGRLHPKKGLRELVEGWQLARRDGGSGVRDWRLVIAGWDEVGLRAELEAMCVQLGVADSVSFPGPVLDAEKRALCRAAAAFVLPSFSEGLPMAVLEGWSFGLPVLMTPACNLPEGMAAGAALSAEPTPGALAQGILQLAAMDTAGRREMGGHGRRLVADQFTPQAVAAQMAQVYEWLLGGGPRPGCVHA